MQIDLGNLPLKKDGGKGPRGQRPKSLGGSGSSRSLLIIHQPSLSTFSKSPDFLSDLAVALKSEGWQVSVLGRVSARIHPRLVSFVTLFASSYHGLFITYWSGLLFFHRLKRNKPAVVLVGNTPIFGILLAGFIKRLFPEAKLVHWSLQTQGGSSINQLVTEAATLNNRKIHSKLTYAYGQCDLIVDSGPVAREELSIFNPKCRKVTITPWSHSEPDDFRPRKPNGFTIVKQRRNLALIYEITTIGNCFEKLFSDFVSGSKKTFLHLSMSYTHDPQNQPLGSNERPKWMDEWPLTDISNTKGQDAAREQLNNADICVMTMGHSATGSVLPWQFFEALAFGKPILFFGDSQSSIGRFICDLELGWIVSSKEELDSVLSQLKYLSEYIPKLVAIQRHCWEIYRQHFCRDAMLRRWKEELCLLAPLHSTIPKRHSA